MSKVVDPVSEKGMALEAIRYDGSGLTILNQLLLPTESIYEELKTVEDAWSAIRSMKVGAGGKWMFPCTLCTKQVQGYLSCLAPRTSLVHGVCHLHELLPLIALTADNAHFLAGTRNCVHSHQSGIWYLCSIMAAIG